MFFDVYRVCPAASAFRYTSYIAQPTAQTRELADSEKLLQLNQQFVDVATAHSIQCVNFLEGAKIRTRGGLKFILVPPEYAGQLSEYRLIILYIYTIQYIISLWAPTSILHPELKLVRR